MLVCIGPLALKNVEIKQRFHHVIRGALPHAGMGWAFGPPNPGRLLYHAFGTCFIVPGISVKFVIDWSDHRPIQNKSHYSDLLVITPFAVGQKPDPYQRGPSALDNREPNDPFLH